MQIVDVLGHHQDLVRPVLLEPDKGEMGGVRRHVAGQEPLAAGIVEGVDPFRCPREGRRRRHVLDADLGPDAVGIAEGVEAGILGDAGAGENDDGTGYDLGGHVKEPAIPRKQANPLKCLFARHIITASAAAVR